MADDELALPGGHEAREHRLTRRVEQVGQPGEPLRIGGVEPQLTCLEEAAFEHLCEPFIEPRRQAAPVAEPQVGVGVPCLVGERREKLAAGLLHEGRVVFAGLLHAGERGGFFPLPPRAGASHDLGPLAGGNALRLELRGEVAEACRHVGVERSLAIDGGVEPVGREPRLVEHGRDVAAGHEQAALRQVKRRIRRLDAHARLHPRIVGLRAAQPHVEPADGCRRAGRGHEAVEGVEQAFQPHDGLLGQ